MDANNGPRMHDGIVPAIPPVMRLNRLSFFQERDVMRNVLLVLYIALASLAMPAHADINDDILVVVTPEGDGGDDGGGLGTYCDDCCEKYSPTQHCIEICGCGPGICEKAHLWMRSAGVQWPVVGGVVASFETTRERASSTQRGRMLLSRWESHGEQLEAIFARDPALAMRAGMALARYWPWNMWTDSGAKAHKVSREALAEAQKILTAIAEADETREARLATTIRTEILPQLTSDLIGKPHRRAFLCFIGRQSCH